MIKQKGIFISVEGTEGSGKSTLIKDIENWLKQTKLEYVLTREPGGVKIAEQVRDIILDNNNKDMDPRTEAILYAASRRQHLVDVVNPALLKNKIVICDRFLDSSLAYQGIARGLGINEVLKLNEFATEGQMPEITILLDANPSIGLKRVKERNTKMNRLDMEPLEFHELVYKAYNDLAIKYPTRIVKFDASGTPEALFKEVKTYLEERLSK